MNALTTIKLLLLTPPSEGQGEAYNAINVPQWYAVQEGVPIRIRYRDYQRNDVEQCNIAWTKNCISKSRFFRESPLLHSRDNKKTWLYGSAMRRGGQAATMPQ